jgi:hypothetical protein
MKDYILFIPPIDVIGKDPMIWNTKEAKHYFNWFISIKDDRVDHLLTSIDEVLTDDPEADVKRIGKKVTDFLFGYPFSNQEESKLIITNKGLALAADLSLLIAKLIMENHPQITWGIVKRPKRDISYNLPALFGFPIVEHLELMGASIRYARAILESNNTSSVWVEMYNYAMELINGDIN